MPTASVHYFRAKKFPELLRIGQSVSTEKQLLLADVGWPDARTEFTYLGLAQDQSYRRYGVRHEDLRHVNARFRNEPVRELFFVYDFQIFRSAAGVLFCKGAVKPVVNRAFRALEDTGLETESVEVDLGLILKRLKESGEGLVKGGWFGDLVINKVDAAGIFGNDVDESDEWERYSSSGSLNAVTVDLVVAGAHESFQLTRDRTIVVYRSKTEPELLEFAEAIHKMVDAILAGSASSSPGTDDTSAPSGPDSAS